MAAALEPAATAFATLGILGLTSPAAKRPGTVVPNIWSISRASTTRGFGSEDSSYLAAMRSPK